MHNGLKKLSTVMLVGLLFSPLAWAKVSDSCQRMLARTDQPQLGRSCTHQTLTAFQHTLQNLTRSLAYAKSQSAPHFQEETIELIADYLYKFDSYQSRFDLNDPEVAELNFTVAKAAHALQQEVDTTLGRKNDAALERTEAMIARAQSALERVGKQTVALSEAQREAGLAGLKSQFEAGRSSRAAQRQSVAQALAIQAQQRANEAVAAQHADIIARHTRDLQAAKQHLAESESAVRTTELSQHAADSAVQRAEAGHTQWTAASQAIAAEAWVGHTQSTISATELATQRAQAVADAREILVELSKGGFANLDPTGLPAVADINSASKIGEAYQYYLEGVQPKEATLASYTLETPAATIAQTTTELDTARGIYANKVAAAKTTLQAYVDSTLQTALDDAEAARVDAEAKLADAKAANDENDQRIADLAASMQASRELASSLAETDPSGAAAAQREAASALVALNEAQDDAASTRAALASAQDAVVKAGGEIAETTSLLSDAQRRQLEATSRDAEVTEKTPRVIPDVRRFEIHDCTRSGDYTDDAWCGYIEPALYERSGNSDVLQFSVRGALSQRTGDWEYGLLADLNYVRSDGEITDDTFWVGGKVRYQLCDVNSLYNEAALESKQRRGYKYLISDIIGIEHDYVRNARYAISGALGLGVRRSKTTEDIVQTDFTQEVRGQLSMGLTPSTSIDQLLAAEFGNFGDSLTTTTSVTTLTTKISDNASMNYTLRLDHLSEVPAGTRKLDVVGKVGLRYDFF